MTEKRIVIESAMSEYRPQRDADLIRYINARLVHEGHAQLNCCERKAVLDDHSQTVDA